MSFEQFDLSESILRAISDLGFTKPSDIQVKAIPILKNHNGDFVGQAQTGTGKTAAFVIPLLETIDSSSRDVQSLVLAPTRELANQVYQEIEKLAKYLPIRATTVYGGVPYPKQISAIKKDRPHIIVGTPGRVIDLIDKGILKLDNCHNLTIDEADEMLNMGFFDDVQTIIESLNNDKKMWMFSATMPRQIQRLIESQFNTPKYVQIEKKTLSNEDITQYYCLLKRRHFPEGLQRLMDGNEDLFGIVFCETRRETKELSELLISQGVSVASLHGELGQGERDIAMKKFKDRKVDLLICTDVAARGIDVSNITHVINMGFPRQHESYVHRIGRTGRAGVKGQAISFITPDDMRKLKQLEALTGQKIVQYTLPDSSLLKKAKITKELDKMDKIKAAIVDTERAFQIDETFSYFETYFSDLSKDDILKLLFSYRFNREIRQIDDSEHLTSPQFSTRPSGRSGSGGRGGNRRRPSRSDSRRSDSRRGSSPRRSESSDGDSRRADSRRGDSRRSDSRNSDSRRPSPRRDNNAGARPNRRTENKSGSGSRTTRS
jgi:ATP-dependent RNA helicase DeaD